MKFQEIKNYFDNLRQLNEELSSLDLDRADARCGQRVALVERGEHGTINPKSGYITHSEMKSFLDGFIFAKEKITSY